MALSVVALSLGTPALHNIHGHETLTSIVRTPFDGPITLDTDQGIAEHRSAIHNAHVYAFFSHHYDYWTARLGIDRAAWNWCHWGENLTIAAQDPSLNETSIFVGDVWEFEGGLALQVTGTRVPCSRLAWRCGQKSDWLPHVAKVGFCGVYLRVLQRGQIRAGDKARIVPYMGSIRVPVSSIPFCMYAPASDPATRDLALQILQHPDLQDMNRQALTRKLSMIEDQTLSGKNAWMGWRQLRISCVEQESADVKSFFLVPVDQKPLASFVPGQFLPIRLPSGAVRCWSISSWAGSTIPKFYRISVKKGPNASGWLHDSGQENVILDVRSPAGYFTLDLKPQYPPRQIYISAGIGITALLPMLQAHFSHETFRRTPAIWMRVVRNSATSQLLSNDIPQNEYTKEFLTCKTFFTQPEQTMDIKGQNYDYAGRPTQDSILELLRDPYFLDPMRITPIQIPGNVGTAYICGPHSFCQDMRSLLLLAKVSESAIHTESFSVEVPSLLSLSNSVPEESVIRFTRSKKEVIWKEGTSSILELAESEGLKPEFGCRFGSCGSCEVKLNKGNVHSWGEKQEDEGLNNMVRICCAVPTSRLVELEF
ncbi:PK beta-barrel-protein domain-containing protein-like protein [Periconia macrospinosa]|uniref:PK beta-barrel-protein domain-containing protein-like protein n=1 Tax=Periconia macrospinosa TaxID=97972 RepID=A0A2V1DQV9_9PLEO|nr:PK beta-barrel-protein domain-containing protein-like protein [Periconia macrospinosa]